MKAKAKNTMKILFFVLIILHVAFIIGCILDNDKSSSINGTNDYFPMHVGNSWTFAYCVLNVGDQEKEINFSIVESRRIGNNDYYVFEKRPPFLFLLDHTLEKGEIVLTGVRINKQGDIILWFDQEELLIYKFSDPVGTVNIAHAASRPRFEDGIDFYSILRSVEDTVVTQAGTFEDCHHFLIHIAQIKGTIINVWFAPQIGPVRFRGFEGTTNYFIKSAVINGKNY